MTLQIPQHSDKLFLELSLNDFGGRFKGIVPTKLTKELTVA